MDNTNFTLEILNGKGRLPRPRRRLEDIIITDFRQMSYEGLNCIRVHNSKLLEILQQIPEFHKRRQFLEQHRP